MPNNEFSFEQTNAMRQAIDIVICHLGGSDDIKRQTEVARVVLITAISRREYDADTLANLTMSSCANRRARLLKNPRTRSSPACTMIDRAVPARPPDGAAQFPRSPAILSLPTKGRLGVNPRRPEIPHTATGRECPSISERISAQS
jgi:hypothetical protein